MWYPFKNTISTFLISNFKPTDKEHVSKKKKIFVLVVILIISGLFINIYFDEKKLDVISKEANQKAKDQISEINKRLRIIRLDNKADKLNISKEYHRKYPVSNYYRTSISKDTIFYKKNKQYLLKKGTVLKVIEMENGDKYYLYRNMILNKDKK